MVECRVDVEWPFDSWDFSAVLTDPLHRDEDERVTVELFGIGPEGDVYVVFTADIADQPDLRAPPLFFSFLA